MRNSQFYTLLFVCLGICSCTDDEPVQSCRVNVANSSITVTANVSGEEGTQITPDVIEQSSITSNSSEISFTVHKVGRCHEVVDYGHVWSKEYATPTKENANQSNYGSNVNFGDEVRTLMSNLIANKKYFVRGYVTVRSLEDHTEKTLYNNIISSFTTLRECNDGETQIDDSDRRTVYGQDDSTGIGILSFEVVKERTKDCIDGAWVVNNDNNSQENHVYIKNYNVSNAISCSYEIKQEFIVPDPLNPNVVSFNTSWIHTGTLDSLPSGTVQKVYLNSNINHINGTRITASLTNIIYK